MSMSSFLSWLQNQQVVLDSVIAEAGRKFHTRNRILQNYEYDLIQCQSESFNLANGRDLCYDRLNTALCYSLWYHPRRVNEFLSTYVEALTDIGSESTTIYDLGAGTGAVQWSVAMIYHWLAEQGRDLPPLKIVNVDSSPLMLYYNRSYLWPAFLRRFPRATEIQSEFSINSWNTAVSQDYSRKWLAASYLFDVSDGLPGRRDDTVATQFAEMVERQRIQSVFLLTSAQPEKRVILDQALVKLKEHGYRQILGQPHSCFSGTLSETSELRHELGALYPSTTRLATNVTWDERLSNGVYLQRQQSILAFDQVSTSEQRDAEAMYRTNAMSRSEVELSDRQKRAARHTDRPTIINGPAGSGKSIVLTERVKNLVQTSSYDAKLNILVVTFNKELSSQISTWIQALLDTSKTAFQSNKGDYLFTFAGASHPNVTVRHFDLLPTRIGKDKRDVLAVHECKRRIDALFTDNERASHSRLFNADYIWDEYYRVYYGLQAQNEEKYLRVERRGRPRLNRGSANRKRIWELLQLLNSQNDWVTFYSKRDQFLELLKSGQVSKRFTHVFLDEYQDCTPADFEIMYELLEDHNNFVIAGDAAQAVHLGRFAEVPRKMSREMQRREIIHLKTSFRMPYRISESLAGLSQQLAASRVDTHEHENVVAPRKDAPPGARPIVLYGSSVTEVANKLKAIVGIYRLYEIDSVTILENDSVLRDELRSVLAFKSDAITSDSILRLKGLERPFVLWSTRVDIENKGEVSEFVYTILSRATKILVIVIMPDTLMKYREPLRLLRKNHLIFWDQQSEQGFDDLCSRENNETVFYEETDLAG